LDDPALKWRERTGNVTLGRTRLWIDALKKELAHFEQLERLGGG
jgi:hypothetical protein